MDQVKEILRQMVKYRFWIIVGIAALLPLIAYFVCAPGLDAEAAAEEAKIKGTYEEVKKYENAQINGQYKDIVKDKTSIVTKDVNAAWRKLYLRQAPLLTWPTEVERHFGTWGRTWPERTDPQLINQVITDYIQVYQPYVDAVYKSFTPFNYETGEGIVASPSEDMLLQPAKFSEESLPDLTKVWASQERLWVQRTILDVIAKVNEKYNSKDWETAAIKEILELQVANSLAQDQKSIAQGKALTPAPAITAPGAPAQEKTAETSNAGNAQMTGMMGGKMGGGIGSDRGSSNASSDTVEYLESPNPDQYYIVPIYLSVLIDQDKIPELFAQFRNSPMAIQLLDFEVVRPLKPVTKPKKGAAPGGSMGMMGEMMGGRRGGGAMAYGGQMMAGMMGGGMPEGYAAMGNMAGNMASMRAGQGMGPMGEMMGGGGAAAKKGRSGGVDVAAKNEAAAREAAKKKKAAAKGTEKAEVEPPPAEADPYYYVVRVTVTGQARFYKTPPQPESPSESVTADETKKGEAGKDEPKPDEAKKGEPKSDGKGGEPAKVEDKDEKATEPAPAKKNDVKPDDAKKDGPKTDEPKTEAPKADEPAKAEPKADKSAGAPK